MKQLPLVNKELLREVIMFAVDITKNPSSKMKYEEIPSYMHAIIII